MLLDFVPIDDARGDRVQSAYFIISMALFTWVMQPDRLPAKWAKLFPCGLFARRQIGTRGVFSTERLLCFGADEGARSLGLESWPEIQVDAAHDSLRGVEPADLLDALVSSCSADVVSGG